MDRNVRELTPQECGMNEMEMPPSLHRPRMRLFGLPRDPTTTNVLRNQRRSFTRVAQKFNSVRQHCKNAQDRRVACFVSDIRKWVVYLDDHVKYETPLAVSSSSTLFPLQSVNMRFFCSTLVLAQVLVSSVALNEQRPASLDVWKPISGCAACVRNSTITVRCQLTRFVVCRIGAQTSQARGLLQRHHVRRRAIILVSTATKNLSVLPIQPKDGHTGLSCTAQHSLNSMPFRRQERGPWVLPRCLQHSGRPHDRLEEPQQPKALIGQDDDVCRTWKSMGRRLRLS